MTTEHPYRPISCDFHDILEAAASLRRVVPVEFLGPAGDTCQRQARIVDLLTRPEGEYMQLDSGESIRFDRIVSVDGHRLADHFD